MMIQATKSKNKFNYNKKFWINTPSKVFTFNSVGSFSRYLESYWAKIEEYYSPELSFFELFNATDNFGNKNSVFCFTGENNLFVEGHMTFYYHPEDNKNVEEFVIYLGVPAKYKIYRLKNWKSFFRTGFRLAELASKIGEKKILELI